MRHLDCFRPVTRRQLRIRYISPAACVVSAISSGSGSSGQTSATIDISPVGCLPGPESLTLTVGEVTVQLVWTSQPYIYSYSVQRATSPEGPWETIADQITGLEYTDTPGGGVFYYRIEGVEPNYGPTCEMPASAPASFGVSAPTALPATNITSSGFTANWTA